MSPYRYVRALAAILLIAINSTDSASAEPATTDWLRGSGKDLQICLRGEVFESDGQPPSDLQITCGMNVAGSTPQLKPKIDGHRFELWIRVNETTLSSLWLKATSARSNHVAYKRLNAYELRQAAIDQVKLALRSPTRRVIVFVTEKGEPVSGATVKADLGYGIDTRSQTDAGGIARFELLPDQKLRGLMAWTNDFRIGGFGFDRGPTRDPNENVHFVELSKCRDQKLRFIDEDGSPVPGVESTIQLATPSPNFNYIGTNENSRLRADAAGEVVYRWFPDWKEHHYYVDRITNGWILDGDPEVADDAIVVKLKKKSADRKLVTGRVVSAGTGVGGFYVTLQSFQSEQENHSDFMSTFTDSDGKFEVNVLPDATYCAYVLDSRWVGDIIDLIPYQSLTDQFNPLELSVSAGHEVKVLVTSGPQKVPYPNLTLSFRREHKYSWQEEGETRNGIGGPQWWATTDESGRATTHALPGELNVSVYSPKWRTEQTVDVGGQGTTVELHREVDEKRTVKGRVILPDGTRAEPTDVVILAAAVDGNYTDQQSATCNEDGSFSFETLATEMGVFGYTTDGQAAGSVVVTDLDKPFELSLRPTLNYEGQLLGEGDRPLVGHGVRAIVRVKGDEKPNSTASTSFEAKRIETKTDEQGNFTLTGVPSELEVNVYADAIDGSGGSEFLEEILLEPDDVRPRTVSRLTEAPPKRSELPLADRYAETLRDGAASGYRVMVVLSTGPGGIDEFVQNNFADHERNSDVYSFMQMHVAINPDRLSAADATFLKERNWELPAEGHVVAYAIDVNGKELERLEIDARDDGAAAVVGEFIRRHALPQADAAEKWAEAFAEAKRSNRRVWARVSQRYCGPCFRLARWLDDQHVLLEKDYVMLKVDDFRDQNGADVAQRLTLGKQHGIPFFAIFDQEEKLLIDSAGPLGNIGYPGKVESRNHVRRMLLETRQNLTDAEVEQLVLSLED